VSRHLLRLACLLILLTIGLVGQAQAATVIANGNDPDSIVDRDGVTHVVWNESRPGTDDVLHYCQIPRGGTACSNSVARTPAGGGSDTEGPHVMVTPFGEVILMTNRNFENLIYVSDDGGLTFPDTPASIGTVGASYTGSGARALFDGADRRVVTIAGPTQGVRLQASPLAAEGNPQPQTTTYAALTNYSAYYPSVVQLDRNAFVAAWQDLNGTTFVRTYTCTLNPCPLADVNDAAKWTPQVAIPDAEFPQLATGPSGTFVMYRGTSGDADNKYFVRKVDGTKIGPARPVSDGNGGNFRDIVQDAGGILHALFIDKDTGLGYRASADGGVTWGDQQTLVKGPDYTLGHIRVTARSVDEGFTGSALWESQNGGEQNPRIFLEGLPDPSISLRVTPPAIPGLPIPPTTPGTPPPPPAACRLLTFAAVDVIADACLVRQGDTYTATGGVKINGLRVELGSGKLKFDIKKRTITSSGASVTVKVGDTVLYKNDINWTLPKASIASLGSIDVSGGGDLIGFPLKGSAEIKLRGGGAEIPVHLGLPALFGGVTGDVTIRADNVAGVHLRELHVKVGSALIGPLEIKNLFFDYDADKVTWAGGATLILPPQPPGPSLEGKIGFSKGSLDYLSNELTLPGPGIVLDPFGATYLKKIRFELKTQPSLQLKGGVTINAGPEIAGVPAVNVDGDLTFTLGDPAILRADGRVSLVKIPLGSAFFELRTNGYVGFGGQLGFEESGFGATAKVSGWLFKTAFNAEAEAKICVGDLGCAGGQVVFSSEGFAGCAEIGPVDAGAGYKWGEGLDIMWSGCDIGPYRATASAAQVGGARSVTFGTGLPAGVVAVEGQGGAPHVALVGPGGARIEDTPGAKSESGGSVAFHNPQTNTTYFVLAQPAAGTWTIEPAADSVPVVAVKSADGLKDPKVSGSVQRSGNGHTRVLSYNVTPLPGQKVTFAEQGNGAAKPIGGVAKDGRGTIRFTPADGPGGTRKIIASVSSYGKPRTQLTIASYVAPPPAKPATVKRLKARRSGTKLAVTWSTAANAKRYELRATLSDGRRLFVRQKSTRFSIPGVASKTRATITVAGLKGDGTRGKKATVKVAAKKAKKK
jgi:hypothetical protein